MWSPEAEAVPLVIRNEWGDIEGVEAVIDKDLASSLLARCLGADTFIISTVVDAAYLNFGKENQRPINHATLADIKRYLLEGHFKAGSMKPKIEAIIQFLEGGGKGDHHVSPEPFEIGQGGIQDDGCKVSNAEMMLFHIAIFLVRRSDNRRVDGL